MNILRIGATASWDFRRDMAQSYAMALRNAIELHLADGTKKQECFFLSLKGTQTARGNFEDRLYVGDVRYVENHLRWNDEELADDDQIVNVVVIEGPVTRDGGACSYGTKDFRNQIIYANSIPQVVGHIFVCNTPGGESACRNDYDEMFASCRANNKKTVQYVDGMCGSSGVNLGCRCDRVIVRNPKDDYGCIGSMAAFWATPDGAVDHHGTRYVEVVGDKSPNKNDWYREAAQGDYEKLMEMINRDTEEFQQTVRENRPNVKEEHLTGTVFEAQEVLGSLVDEIGDFDRAIECVLQLADGSLASVRDAEVIMPDEKPEEEPAPGEEPEERIETVHVGFTPVIANETLTHQNENNMTEEEKKAAEAAEEQQAAEQVEQPAAEAAAEEAPATEAPAASEEAPAQEGTEAPAEEAPAQEEEKPAEEEEKPAEEAPANEEEQPASQETIENAEAKLDKIQETLHNAEQMIADKDKEIADLKESLDGQKNTAEQLQADIDQARKDIETANGTIAERDVTIAARDKSIEEKDALIDQLKKQVSDLKAEVKELAGKPAPMTDAAAGIPQDNGTGEAPKQTGSGITSEMSYEEVRAQVKKAAAEKAAKKKEK